MKNKQILKEYENMEFNIHSYTEDIEIEQHTHKVVLDYFKGNIDFNELLLRVDGECPPNSCFWCNHDCDKCDLESEFEDIMITGYDCFECWRRCLEQESIEEPKIDLYDIAQDFRKMCNSFDIQCKDCKYETCSEECDNTNCCCLNENFECCKYGSIEDIEVDEVECFVKYLQDNYDIGIKPKESDANV